MSHFTRLRTRIREKDVLVRALSEMGCDVAEDAEIQGFEGRRRVDLAVRMKSGYDVGFSRDADGFYEMVADWWGVRGVSEGDFAGRLEGGLADIQERIKKEMEELDRRTRHQYALKTTLANLSGQGFQVVRQTTDENGTVRILARRWR